jgi:EAL domain-containing protein (putative c-di-GMP-specific phosphodiesterase class I)/ABC-type amino acid transport substrate-binding protein
MGFRGWVSDQDHGVAVRACGWLLAALAATPAFAGDAATGVLRMGGDADYPPYQFIDDGGRADGFDVALAREVAAELGLEPRFELGDWDRALQRLERGELDVVPMFWSAERERRFLFTQPIMIRHHALFGPRDRPVLSSLDELADVRVAVQRAGLAAEALHARAGPGVRLVEVDTEAESLAAVVRGDADYALAPTGIGYHAIRHQHLDLIALSPPLLERKYAFAVPRDRPGLVGELDAALGRLRASGVQNELYVEWIGNLGPHRPRTWPMLAALLVTLAALGLAAYGWTRTPARHRPSTRMPSSDTVSSLAPDASSDALLAELQAAIDADRLGFMLQPKLDLHSGRWVGAELLVRWDHPQRGPLAPDEFVPLAERARVIGKMSLHLLRCGLAHCREWPQSHPPLHLAVNVSANDLADPQLVDAIIAASATSSAGLMLEVTETDVMREPEHVAAALPRLRAHGIRISVDDFGAGHSSLVNLRRLAPDELKIDRSFVSALLTSHSDQAIVSAIIGLGHDLGATVAAEGIEDEATWRWLAEAGCDTGQGFGIARPMAPEAFAELLRSNRAPPVPAPSPDLPRRVMH